MILCSLLKKKFIAARIIHFHLIDLFAARTMVFIINPYCLYCLMIWLALPLVFRLSCTFPLGYMSRSSAFHLMRRIKTCERDTALIHPSSLSAFPVGLAPSPIFFSLFTFVLTKLDMFDRRPISQQSMIRQHIPFHVQGFSTIRFFVIITNDILFRRTFSNKHIAIRPMHKRSC